MMELSLKNDICIGMKYVFGFFMIFQIFSKKMQMLNYSKRLSMRREIQNPLLFETDPESFSLAKHFTYVEKCHGGAGVAQVRNDLRKHFSSFLKVNKR
jgi:hypothetical protein